MQWLSIRQIRASIAKTATIAAAFLSAAPATTATAIVAIIIVTTRAKAPVNTSTAASVAYGRMNHAEGSADARLPDLC